MEDRTKQRLIGILVLLGALFIILPFLFHNARPSLNTAIAQTTPGLSVTLPPDNATLANNNTTKQTDSSTTPSQTTTTDSTDDDGDTLTAQHTPTHAITTAAVATTKISTTAAPLTLAAHELAQPLNSNTFTPDQSVSSTSGLTTGAPSGQPAGTVPVTLPVSQAVTTTQAESLNQTAATTPIATPSAPKAATSTSVSTTTPTPIPAAAIVPVPAKIKPLVPVKHKPIVTRGGWSVQLAAFADKKNANDLLAKLRARHFQAYTRTISHGREQLILVFAGPERTEYEARWVQGRLKQEFHLTGIVGKHN